MGGEKWYERYDALLRKIQRLLSVKESEQGLKAAERLWELLHARV